MRIGLLKVYEINMKQLIVITILSFVMAMLVGWSINAYYHSVVVFKESFPTIFYIVSFIIIYWQICPAIVVKFIK